MCGIAGLAGPVAQKFPRELLVRMCELIEHRGPDDQGLAFLDRTHMGMRRLAVIDVTSGQQPIRSENGDITVTFNGEIYNFVELRTELEQAGHRFRTQSDTEVIATGFQAWGAALFARLNGMFAIAVHQESTQELVLVRDHIGIKPLYIAQLADGLVWGSEIKSVLACRDVPKRLDVAALQEFLVWEYVPGQATLFRDVRSLAPGSYLSYNLRGGTCQTQQYWQIDNEPANEQHDPRQWQEIIGSQLEDSVKAQLVSDVPLGAFLSGGVDSSLIVSHMGAAHTFSIGFDDPSYNELAYAQQVANHLGVEHTNETLKPDAVALFEQLMYHMDDPIADFSIFPTYLVSKLTRDHVTVALSGDGGDELFGGYDSYVAQHYGQTYDRLPDFLRTALIPTLADLLPPTAQKKGLINKIKRFAEGGALPPALGHARWRLFATHQDLAQLMVGDAAQETDIYGHITRLRDRCNEMDPVNQALFIDTHSYLVDNCLVKVDRMSMAASLETRVPFLDPTLIKSAFRMPGELKLNGTETKPLLKQLAAERVPHDCVYRNKEGFSIPIKQWLANEFRGLVDHYLNNHRIRTQGVFNPARIEQLIAEHLANKANHSHRLWALIMFQAWYDRWFEGNTA